MSRELLDAELLRLRAAALRAFAREAGVVVQDWQVKRALEEPDFTTAVESVRRRKSWYVMSFDRVRGWFGGVAPQ